MSDPQRTADMTNPHWALLGAPAATRVPLAALWALDRTLGQVLRTTREPMLGQMRLAWWREAIARLDSAPPPAEPVLGALATTVLPRGVGGAAMAAMVDGWEALLADDLDRAALEGYAAGRGGTMFAVAAAILGAGHGAVKVAGEGWALADLAANVSASATVHLAWSMAAERLSAAFARAWPRAIRPLGGLALSARADLAGLAPASPRRAARLAIHRLTGR